MEYQCAPPVFNPNHNPHPGTALTPIVISQDNQVNVLHQLLVIL
jgi:hypothetical protein